MLTFFVIAWMTLLKEFQNKLNKSAILYGPKDIRIEDMPMPILNSDEVLIKSTDVSICATEVKYWYHGIPNVSKGTKVIQGHELGGIIEDAGSCQNFEKAMRVAVDPSIWCGICDMCINGMSNLCRNLQFMSLPPVDGGFQQFYKVLSKNVYPIPSDIPPDCASMVEPVCVVLNAISDAKKISGSFDDRIIAIVGAGSLGIILTQALRLYGSPRMICVLEPLAYRLKMAERFGADVLINPNLDKSIEAIMDVTKGLGADIVFEVSGDFEAYQIASNISKPAGSIIIVGIPVDQDYIPIKSIIARRAGLALKFVRRFNPKDFPQAIELIASGKVNVIDLISHKFPIEEISQAFELLHQHLDNALKVIIHPHQES
jgi:L-iditol 2-dehydrogenase